MTTKNRFTLAQVADVVRGTLRASFEGTDFALRTKKEKATGLTSLTIKWKLGPTWDEVQRQVEKFRRRSSPKGAQVCFDTIGCTRLDEHGREIE